MGRLFFMIVSASIIFGGVMLSNGVQRSAVKAEERLSEHAATILARENALTGFNEAKHLVMKDWAATGSYTGSTTLTGEVQGGGYTVTIILQGPEVAIKAVGRYDDQTYTLSSIFDENAEPSVPPFMGYANLSDGNLQIKEDLTIRAANPQSNADVHANGNLQIQEGTVLIEGFGYANGNIQVQNGQSAEDVFQPNSNPDNLPVTQEVSEIEVPKLEADQYAAIATKKTMSNLDLSGNYVLGTRENPVIWYVKGNVTTTGPVTFSGYGIFVTTGNFHISHNVTTENVSGESNVGFYSDGNFELNQGSLTVSGQIFANGNVHLKADTILNGSISSEGNLQTFGTVTINYYPASVALTEPIWEGEEGSGVLTLASIREW